MGVASYSPCCLPILQYYWSRRMNYRCQNVIIIIFCWALIVNVFEIVFSFAVSVIPYFFNGIIYLLVDMSCDTRCIRHLDTSLHEGWIFILGITIITNISFTWRSSYTSGYDCWCSITSSWCWWCFCHGNRWCYCTG